jgi:hypothetical protein
MMEKISWTGYVINEKVLHRVKEECNAVREIERRNANRTGHNLLTNCLLKQLIEGRIEGRM